VSCFVISTASTPLFVGPSCPLADRLTPLLVRGPYSLARHLDMHHRGMDDDVQKYEQHYRWTACMLTYVVFITQSRVIMFAYNVALLGTYAQS
jgi:hypothetical protein